MSFQPGDSVKSAREVRSKERSPRTVVPGNGGCEVRFLAGAPEGDPADSHHKAPEGFGGGWDRQGVRAVVGSRSHVRLGYQSSRLVSVPGPRASGLHPGSNGRRRPVCFEGEARKNPKPCGYLVIYVDFLAVGPTSLVENVIKRINQEWVCSAPEWVKKAGWTKFCGMELKWDEDGETLRVRQPSYISELMQRHEVMLAKPAPFYKPEVPENPVVTQDGIREAQGLVGELLWVSVRTRPDVAFGVSWMSQHALYKS